MSTQQQQQQKKSHYHTTVTAQTILKKFPQEKEGEDKGT